MTFALWKASSGCRLSHTVRWWMRKSAKTEMATAKNTSPEHPRSELSRPRVFCTSSDTVGVRPTSPM